jgi:hypothetical protein
MKFGVNRSLDETLMPGRFLLFGSSESEDPKRRNRGSKEDSKRRMRKTITRFRQFITPFSSIRHKNQGTFEEQVSTITRF